MNNAMINFKFSSNGANQTADPLGKAGIAQEYPQSVSLNAAMALLLAQKFAMMAVLILKAVKMTALG